MSGIRSLTRGFEVLHLLKSGGLRAADITRALAIPRSTVLRVLGTLQALGYIYRRSDDKRYRLAIKIRELSDGYTDNLWLDEHVLPVLRRLSQDVVWPVGLSTFNGLSMVVRATTDRSSPLSAYNRTAGYQMPVLSSASGRVFLAHCTLHERKTILQVLARAPQSATLAMSPSLDVKNLDVTLKRVRRQGYEFASSAGSIETAFTVPIRTPDKVLACLTVRYFTSSMTRDAAKQRYLPKLLRAAEHIAKAYGTFSNGQG